MRLRRVSSIASLVAQLCSASSHPFGSAPTADRICLTNCSASADLFTRQSGLICARCCTVSRNSDANLTPPFTRFSDGNSPAIIGNVQEPYANRHSCVRIAVKEEVAKHGSIRELHVTLWRCNPDATGCNWNARIERVRGRNSSDAKRWWDVVPQMRGRFNLK